MKKLVYTWSLLFIFLFSISCGTAAAVVKDEGSLPQKLDLPKLTGDIGPGDLNTYLLNSKQMDSGKTKENLSPAQKKLSSDLLKMVRNTPNDENQNDSALPVLRGMLMAEPETSGEQVYVYIFLNDGVPTSIIEPYTGTITDRDEENHLAAAHVDIDMLEPLASLPGVRTIRKVMPPLVNKGAALTEGDSLHRADILRNQLGTDGSGIKVGIISDGADSWQDAYETGDLPGNVHVLSNKFGGDEGTAMLEIIHDMAPGAELYFHDCGENILQFNQGIDALVDAGCNIICDDIGWLLEPFFEDGMVASHVQSVIEEKNIVYLSSAGNAGTEHYQGMFYNDGSDGHDFSAGSSSVKDLWLDVLPGYGLTVIMQWNDKFGSSGNDYDLYLFNRDTGEPIAYSDQSQDGNDDPLEGFQITNPESDILHLGIGVKKYFGQDKELEIYMYSYGGVKFYPAYLTSEDSIFGHPAAPGAIAVGSLNASDPAQIAYYSCQGPVTIYYPSRENRNKPDICGIDGVSITGAGGFYNPFYGTSAAAPHAAAVAALTWSENPDSTAGEIHDNLLTTAIDLGDDGFDFIYGNGRADAQNSVMSSVYGEDYLWIKSSNPLMGAARIPLNSSVDIIFSQDIQAGVDFDLISLEDENHNKVTVEKKVYGQVLTLNPGTELSYFTDYAVNIPPEAVTDTSGNKLAEANTINFSTAAEPVNIPDPGLRKAIRDELYIPEGREITEADMSRPRRLSADGYGINDLTGLEKAVNLQVLDLTNNNINNISPITNISGLFMLNLDNNQIEDITGIENLTGLAYLDLDNNQIQDLREVENLNGLKWLNLANNQISDFAAVNGLSELTSLNLSSNNITNIPDLSNNYKLEKLYLNKNKVDDIAGLAGAASLQEFCLNSNNISNDNLTTLQGLTSLERLELGDNQISDISSLGSLNNLAVLVLDNNQIEDITAFADLNNLQKLNLSFNNITDISVIAHLGQLKLLFLNNNLISTLPDMSQLINLYGLNLEHNQLNDISPLGTVHNLELLGLGANQISDITELKNLLKLKGIDLTRNNLTDISALAVNSYNGGLGYGDILFIFQNRLDLSEGSPAMLDIEALIQNGAWVIYQQQGVQALPVITSSRVPDGFAGYSYSTKLEAFGGIKPYKWVLKSGALPSGLTLAENGKITGIPVAGGEYTFTVELSDNSDPVQTDSCEFGLMVFPCKPLTAELFNFEPDMDPDEMMNGGMPFKGAGKQIKTGLIQLDLSRVTDEELNMQYDGWADIYREMLTLKPLPESVARMAGFSINIPAGTQSVNVYKDNRKVPASIDDSGRYLVLKQLAGYMTTEDGYPSSDPSDYNCFIPLTAGEKLSHWIVECKNAAGEIVDSGAFTFQVINPGENSGSSSTGGAGGGVISTGTTVSEKGGSAEKYNAAVIIPADAVTGKIKVNIKKVGKNNLPAPPRTMIVGDVLEITKNHAGDFNKPVTITMSFAGSGIDTDKYELGLFWFNEANNLWVELDNVKVDLKTKTVSGEVTHFTKFAVMAVTKEDIHITRGLADIKGHWAEAYIKDIVEKGIVSGDPDGNFRPDDNISREEFCKMIVLAAGISPIENPELEFADSEGISSWARPYVAAAVKAGIIKGYDDNTFKPQKTINRAEIAVMAVRALGNDTSGDNKLLFTDVENIPGWALPAVAQAVDKEIITGFPDNTFRASDTASRAQAAKIIAVTF